MRVLRLKGVFMTFGSSRLASSSLAVVLSLVSAAAHAETLPVSGIYPAGNDEAAAVNSIAIENFGGDKGASLSFAITDALEDAIIQGEPYFELLPSNDGDVDSVMRGSANAEAIEIELEDRKVTKCEKKDANEKCIKEKVTFYECARLEVSVYPQIRLIGADGREIYRKRDSLRTSESFCANDYSNPSIDEMLDGLVNNFARSVRYDLAPVFRDQQIRVLESRKGIKGDAKKAFRNAVKLTKSDIGASCEGFSGLEETYPDHVSVLFNIGLCAEGMGELDRAETYYRRALAVEPGKDYPTDGLRRIADRARADAQLDVHFGPVAEEDSGEQATPASGN